MISPLVSVIIPTYNHRKFIFDAINSVLKQNYPQDKIEIIVIDDGSTDNTKGIIKHYKNKIKYYYQNNSGQAWAVKKGIDASKGKYIFILNADDIFLKNKIKTVVNIFEKDKEIIHVSHPALYWKDKFNIKKEEKFPEKLKGKKISGKELLYYFYFNNKFIGGGSTYAGKARILKKINIQKEFYMFIDEFLAISLLNKGCSFLISKPLSLYRIHENNYSRIDVKKKIKNVKATEKILSEILKNNFDEKIKRLYKLKTIITKLRFKEQTNKKKIKDILDLWRFIFNNFPPSKLNNLKILNNYAVFQRSLPNFMIRLLK